jgi:polynucleotide 5'-hydroxyl-kinase GRC3/NOL9
LDLNLAALRGVLLVVGAPDTGKSTFAHWLFERLAGAGRPVAFLDGDVGQSVLGPPTTLALALPSNETSEVSKDFRCLAHWFVGDVSPRGRMLPLVVGAGRLTHRALEVGTETVVVDTTGLVDPAHGGVALKHALVDQLQPTTLFAFQRTGELEPILAPLRRQPRPRVVELPVSDAVRRRDVETRQAHRADAFRRYFAGTEIVRLSLRERAVFDGRTLAPRRLLALQDADGFTLALSVVVTYNKARDELDVRTPLTEPDAVTSVRLGVIGVDDATGREFRPGRGS